MNDDFGTLTYLAGYFLLLSFLSIGGAITTIPDMHRLAVETHQWMTDRQFADLFALAQLTPGPNVIIVTLIGYYVAGLTGAAVTTIAMCGPTCVLTYYFSRVWDRFRDAPWRIAIQAGLVPVTVGLIAATAWILALAADKSLVAAAITAATALVGYFTKVNPLWIFTVAAALGVFGLL